MKAERTLGVPKGKVLFHQEVFPTEGTRENLSLVAQYSDSQTEAIALSAGATGVKVEVPNRDMEGSIDTVKTTVYFVVDGNESSLPIFQAGGGGYEYALARPTIKTFVFQRSWGFGVPNSPQLLEMGNIVATSLSSANGGCSLLWGSTIFRMACWHGKNIGVDGVGAHRVGSWSRGAEHVLSTSST